MRATRVSTSPPVSATSLARASARSCRPVSRWRFRRATPASCSRGRGSAILRWHGRILLIRHEKPGREYWLLPGGGVNAGESLVHALHRELGEELGIDNELPVEGPVAIVDSISPQRGERSKHVVHII